MKKERPREMRLLYERGYNDVEIAKELDVGRCTVRAWRKRAGLSPNTRFERARRQVLSSSNSCFADYIDRVPKAQTGTDYRVVLSEWLRADGEREQELLDGIENGSFKEGDLRSSLYIALRKAGGGCCAVNRFLDRRLPAYAAKYRALAEEAVKKTGE